MMNLEIRPDSKSDKGMGTGHSFGTIEHFPV